MTNKHLWEIDHPYYCSDSNYYATGDAQPTSSYKSWAEFIEAEGDADFDMNLVFRWDWNEGEDHDLQAFNGDVNYRNGILMIRWMGQRKGLYRWSTIEVCRADEAAVRLFLQPRWKHMKLLWEGIST